MWLQPVSELEHGIHAQVPYLWYGVEGIMSNILTRIKLPGHFGTGRANWGRRSPAEMLEWFRAGALHDKKEAEAILSAPDYAFQIDVIRGNCAQHHVCE